MSWSDMLAQIAELEKKNASFVKLWHPDGPDHWVGDCSECDVEKGEPAYQLSNGKIVNLAEANAA